MAKSAASAKGDYRVPSSGGSFIPADPIKFCLRFKPPTIAIVYQLQSRPGKYVREFRVEVKETGDLSKLCDDLFERERHYFNPQKISKVQVLELVQKLHAHLFPQNKENNGTRKQNFLEKKRFVDYGEPETDAVKDKKVVAAPATTTVLGSKAPNKHTDDEEDDPWDFDNMNKGKKEVPKSNPFDQKVKPAFDDLEDLDLGIVDTKKKAVPDKKSQPQLSELLTAQASKPVKAEDQDNGLFVDNDFGDDFEEESEEDVKVEKKPARDIFENSHSQEAPKNPQEKPVVEKQEEEEDQEKMINEQFQLIYDRDAQLRQVIGAEAASLTLEEKYQILTAYMNGGGVQGLLEDADMDPEEEKAIEEEFKHIYEADAKLREVLGGQAALSQLTLKDKYQILAAYKKGGGVQGLLEDGEPEGAEENSVIEHNG